MKSKSKSGKDLEARLKRLEERLDQSEEREHYWRKRWQKASLRAEKLENLLSLKDEKIKNLEEEIVRLNARIAHLTKLAFGDKSEISPVSESVWEDPLTVRKRGKQLGTKGFGRKKRSQLQSVEIIHDVVEQDKICPSCRAPRLLCNLTETSEEIDYEWKLVRLFHKRLKYKKACRCPGVRTFVTAPAANKLIPKGLFSSRFWTYVLTEKFLLQRPVNKIAYTLNLQGLDISSGTLASGLKQLTKLFAGIYNALKAESRRDIHWQMDETHWRIFVDNMGKDNHKWWMWVVLSRATCVFVLDPSRSSKVPSEHLKDIPVGILSCDRYSAYKKLDHGIELAWCWSHVRRDFLNLKDGYPELKRFAQRWIDMIDQLFRLNKQRLQSRGSDTFEKHDMQLHTHVQKMELAFRRVLKSRNLSEPARHVLSSLQKHWSGLTIFVEQPDIPMDNNASERALRGPVVGRKNYYGAHSIWSGQLSAMMFSIFATLAKNQIDPYRWLSEYLDSCASNGGTPPADLSPFLPWSMTPDCLDSFRLAS